MDKFMDNMMGKSVIDGLHPSWKKFKDNPDSFTFPEKITVELTNLCILYCFMCPRKNLEMQIGFIN